MSELVTDDVTELLVGHRVNEAGVQDDDWLLDAGGEGIQAAWLKVECRTFWQIEDLASFLHGAEQVWKGVFGRPKVTPHQLHAEQSIESELIAFPDQGFDARRVLEHVERLRV